jgi:Zn finger protein HypA/HybF involved in hydrogenase expression
MESVMMRCGNCGKESDTKYGLCSKCMALAARIGDARDDFMSSNVPASYKPAMLPACGYCGTHDEPVRNEQGWLSCPGCNGV